MGRFKNICELLNPRTFKFSTVLKTPPDQCTANQWHIYYKIKQNNNLCIFYEMYFELFSRSPYHYSDVIILSAIGSQITGVSMVCSIFLFRCRPRKTSKLRATGLCGGIHWSPVNFPYKGSVTRKMFPFDGVIMIMLLPLSTGLMVPSILLICLSFLDHTQPVLAIICLLFCTDGLLSVRLRL